MEIQNKVKQTKILLVDDSLLTSIIVSQFLNENGYETETVATGEEAVQKACGSVPFDLILMDIELAGKMNGIEAARKILTSKDIPVIFFTANTSKEIINKIKEVKAYGFVLKGMDKAALLSTAEMALNLHDANINNIMFNRIFENFANEIYIFYSDTLKFDTVNHAARKNLGYTREELSKMTFLDIKPEFDTKDFYEILKKLSCGDQPQFFYNSVHQRKDGTIYPVEINLQLLDYGSKKLFLALAIDLTERSAIKEQLNKKELILNAIINSAQDAIIMLDSKGNVTLWNPAAEKIFGYLRKEMLGTNLKELVCSKKIESINLFNYLQSISQDDETEKMIELTAKHKDGRILNIEVSISFLKIMNNLQCVGIVRDITERKREQAELEYSQKQYLELAENAPIGIVKCDVDGTIIYANQKTAEILGSPSIQETKKINLLTFPLLVQYGFSQKLEESMENNTSNVLEMKYYSKWEKKSYLRLHIKPLSEGNEVTGAQIMIDDITEKKHLEEELRQLSVTDYLTNVYNRRYFIERLEQEIQLLKRGNMKTFSLVMLDVDHFKRINDRFGHNAGDMVLKAITNLIKNRIRQVDCLARWGGEEFTIILHNSPAEQSVILMNQIREKICELNVEGIDKVTASFGVTEYSDGNTVDSLIQKADTLMYQAKKSGRNCVCYKTKEEST